MADLMRLMAFALLAACGAVHAQAADPTQPPAAWLAPAESARPGEDGGGLRLQSVLLRPGGRPVAIIGGQTVVLGERLGEARLIRLNEREAVLQGADGVTHLYLTPDVEKQMIEPPKPRKKGKTGPVKGLP